MKRTHAFATMGFICLMALVFSGLAWSGYVRDQAHARYGAAPALGATFRIAGDPTCQEIVAVNPAVHYNWFGRIWQDESLPWEDVLIQHPPPREFRHDHSGPVKVGDVVCGFGEVSDIRYVHRPTGIVLTETCESYRCPLE